MEQSTSWEANRFSFNREIPRILWHWNIHYRFASPVPLKFKIFTIYHLFLIYTTFNILNVMYILM